MCFLSYSNIGDNNNNYYYYYNSNGTNVSSPDEPHRLGVERVQEPTGKVVPGDQLEQLVPEREAPLLHTAAAALGRRLLVCLFFNGAFKVIVVVIVVLIVLVLLVAAVVRAQGELEEGVLFPLLRVLDAAFYGNNGKNQLDGSAIMR